MLLDLNLEHLSNSLISTWEEMIGQINLLAVGQSWIMANSWVQIEQKGHVQTLVGVQKLIFEAEALNFVEIQGCFLREDLVDGDTSDWSICSVEHFVEAESCLSSIHYNCWGTRLELPRDLILSMGQE